MEKDVCFPCQMQRLLQRLNLVAVLLTVTASNYVYIDLSAVRVLGNEGVLSGVQICLQRIVCLLYTSRCV